MIPVIIDPMNFYILSHARNVTFHLLKFYNAFRLANVNRGAEGYMSVQLSDLSQRAGIDATMKSAAVDLLPDGHVSLPLWKRKCVRL